MEGSLSCSSSSSSFSLHEEDLLIEILLCLPIKTLLRFKSVCKSWLSLIQSSEFIHRHITLSPDNNNNNLLATFIFQSHHPIRHENGSSAIEVVWNMFSVTSDHEYEVLEELPMQKYYMKPKRPSKLLIVGSCNGLICYQDNELRDVSLWNPAIINQFRILPKPLIFAGIGNGEVYKDFVAFGFDVETKDYKVVLVTYFVPQTDDDHHNHISIYQCPYRVQVYSLSTDSWRPLEEDLVIPAYPSGLGWEPIYHGGYLNGSYYGLGEEQISGFPYRHKVSSVLSFDFTKEIFRTTQLPDEIMCASGITLLDEKIAIIDNDDKDHKVLGSNTFILQTGIINTLSCDCTYHIWVLNELGVKESWTKLYTIGPYGALYQRPIGISNNGELILLTGFSNDRKLHLVNPSTQESHVMKGHQFLQRIGSNVFKAIVYRRSLVPVGGTRNPK